MSSIGDRVRVLDNTSFQTGNRKTYYGPGCTSSSTPFQGGRMGVYKEMVDRVTPRFHKRSAKGEIINNPMTRQKNTFTSTPSGYTQTLPGFNCSSGTGGWKDEFSSLLNWKLGPLPPTMSLVGGPAFDVDSLISTACAKALANVKNPSVQGIAFIGELQQTLNLLRNPISAITNIMRKKPSPLKLEKARRGAAGASSQNLAIQFGILPLMHDIEGIIDALFQQVHDRETARGFASDSISFTEANLPLHFGSALKESYYRRDWVGTCEVRAGALYAFSGRTLADSLGLSLRDIPAAAWELLPWSFVVDWFSNVGILISAASAICSNEFLAEYYSVKTTRSVVRTVTSVITAGGWVVSSPSSDSDSGIYETYLRQPTKLGAHLQLQLNLSLSRTPVLSALSLLTQQLTKRK